VDTAGMDADAAVELVCALISEIGARRIVHVFDG
jgi:hypothetical protein